MKELLISCISIAILVYIGLGLMLFVFQRNFIYFPTDQISSLTSNQFYLPSGSERIRVSVLNTGQSSAILYFGGNAEAVEQNTALFSGAFNRHTVYLVNYRGYGGSSGKPSESALFEDAINIYDRLSASHDHISIIGRSLGSGVAIHLAAQRDIDKLILVTPYDSILKIAQATFPVYPMSLLLWDKFDSANKINKVKAKTLMLIAEQDEVIPLQNSVNLAEAFPKHQLIIKIISEASHNTISNSNLYLDSMEEFLTL